MQFWVDFREQFWCELKDCVQGRHGSYEDAITSYSCAKVQCGCVKGQKLCSSQPWGLVNLGPLLEKVVGPASFACDMKGACRFKEKTLDDYFNGGIELDCVQGECVEGVVEAPPIVVPSDTVIILYILLFTFLITAGLLFVFSFIVGSGGRSDDDENMPLLSNPEEETRRLMESHVPATVAFKGISYRLSPRQNEYLLKGVTGVVNPGEVMAIMGGSGAGKTTCLDILANKLKSGVADGEVLVNSNRVRPGGMAEMSGFVDQETKLFGTLTVEETLTYSAMLRLPQSMSTAAKKLRVQQTMAELGIEHLAGTMIGTSGRRGLSGGEQRRVAIACELVTAPRILFLDEPTSGLDAHSAFAVVEALVRMARQHNRTIIISIHQPRSNIFSLFDRLLLLAAGRMVYSGPADEAASHFAGLGYSVPAGFNTADYLVDITMDASVEYSQGRLGAVAEEQGEAPHDDGNDQTTLLPRVSREYSISRMWYFFGSRKPPVVSAMTARAHDRELSTRIAYLEDEFIRSVSGQNLLAVLPKPSGIIDLAQVEERVKLPDQFRVLTERHFKIMTRDPLLILPSYALTVSLALLTSLLFSPLTEDMPGVQNRLGALFFQCAYFAFAGMTVVEGWGGGGVQRAVFLRERAGACYSLVMYYLSRTVLELAILRLLPPLLYCAITYFWIGFYKSWKAFLRHLLAMTLFNMSTASLLQVITMMTTSDSLASLMSTLFLLFSLLFGGFLVNKERIPGLFSLLPRLSPFNYAFEALIVNELREISVKDDSVVDIEIPGRIILKQFGFNANGYTKDISALIVILVLGVSFGFLALRTFVKERR
jgi:ABC-type multidrug transport system ATPase subunit